MQLMAGWLVTIGRTTPANNRKSGLLVLQKRKMWLAEGPVWQHSKRRENNNENSHLLTSDAVPFPVWCEILTFSNGNYVHPNLPFISEPYN